MYFHQYRHYNDNGVHSSLAIQFYRRLPENDDDIDLGTNKRDSFYISIEGW